MKKIDSKLEYEELNNLQRRYKKFLNNKVIGSIKFEPNYNINYFANDVINSINIKNSTRILELKMKVFFSETDIIEIKDFI
ncbi:hypothetical protein P344_05320 [Spiroplasma mirum ATCC 29335]|uniref:Uncharacterized protein n=1 Tax=Spiroplasma mirum ATCC 29335 TaxID=838561 RepID=W6AN00_9MOLU|nr:hypothetical protein P344_05320 [Spiroplasma mirum ATCC 29335]